MIVNNITVPDEGVTKEYIQDPVGGTMYIVLTNVSVQALSLSDFQARVDLAKQEVVTAKALADELETKATELASAVQAVQMTPPIEVIPQ